MAEDEDEDASALIDAQIDIHEDDELDGQAFKDLVSAAAARRSA